MMVHQQHQRFPQLRKGDVEEAKQQDSQEAQALLDDYCTKKTNPRLLSILFFFFSLISCSLVFAPRFSNIPFSYFENEGALKPIPLPCTASTDSNCIYCDRTGYRSDICFMRGDIRTHSSDSSIFLFSSNNLTSPEDTHVQKIKPYTRKWEKSVMDTIEEIKLVKTSLESETQEHACKVTHAVPAVFFSTGGYTGNVYHEFNDGIIPLYITSKKYNKKVVFVISEYHEWWITKYGDILARLSDYAPIDFSSKDPSTHCFSEAVIGLNIHDELSVDPTMMPDASTVQEFRDLLDKAYEPRIRSLIQEEEETQPKQLVQELERPKLVLLSRHGSRAVLNEPQVVKLAEEIGFRVEVLKPEPTTELAKIYRALNGSDVMAGVHGAAMTHFLFMRPGSVFIQVVPLGTEWAAETYYGGPAEKLGLKYMGYKIRPGESSLARKYKMDDPVLTDPESVNKRGWEVTKRVYLDGQDVTLDLGRLKRRLTRVYWYCVNKRRAL